MRLDRGYKLGATHPQHFLRGFMEEEFVQILQNNIKLYDNNLLRVINNKNVTHITYKQVVKETDKGKDVSIIFLAGDESNRRSIALSKFKKTFLKFRAPNVLRAFNGRRIRVYHDMFSDIPEELFRVESVDFHFDASKEYNAKYIYPYITKAGIIVVPKLYVNAYLDERFESYRIAFSEYNIWNIKNGLLDAYITEEMAPMSFKFNIYDGGIKTKPVPELLNIVKIAGRDITEFNYKKTAPMDSPIHRYGTMMFEARKEL